MFEIAAAPPSVIVVDNFYEEPDVIRRFALQHTFYEDPEHYKGVRSRERYNSEELKQKFEELIQEKITESWDVHQYNGCFQITSAENQQVYHCDGNSWAGVLYLSPDAPLNSGTRLHKSKLTGIRDSREASPAQREITFSSGFYDSTKFDTVDNIGNIYNRLVLFRSTNIHSAGDYFGTDMMNGRLVHLFFFDTEV